MAKRVDNTSKFLTTEEIKELALVVKDPYYFSTFIHVVHPTRGKVNFDLYPFQRSVLYQFLVERFNIILKFRQAGITELISMYCLWLAMYHSNKKINIISIKDTVAKKVLKKIKYMYKNLPYHLQTPIINGRSGEYGCVTEDTVLIGEFNNFRIGEITPKSRGVIDISHRGIKVLTHEGTFEKITKAFNKGTKLTYTVKNDRGKTLRGSARHALYTTKGWRFLPDILEEDLDVIFWDASYLDDAVNPQVASPHEKIIKETRYPGYYVSNHGEVYSTKFLKRAAPGELILMCPRKSRNHFRVKLTLQGKKKQVSIHRLIWETFKGEIPSDKVIDHIDCDVSNNCLTNLQCITLSENSLRGKKYNRTWISWNYKFNKTSLLEVGQLKARLKELSSKKGYKYGMGSKVAKEYGLDTKTVSRYRRDITYGHIYVSKITLENITRETIVDIEVEKAHSYITESNYINHNTAEELEFSNGSFIASIPTTEDAGRSEGLSLLVIDEAAVIRWASTIWASSFPTLSTGGSAIINSTPMGTGGFYHGTWVDAVSGHSPINPIRLYWNMHPERNQIWYDEMSRVLGPRRTAQEIDGDFLSSGNTVFDISDIKAVEEMLSEYPPIITRFNGQYKQFNLPEKGKEYYFGADVSTGRSTDYSAFTGMDSSGEEVAVFKGRIPINKYGKLLGDVGERFNFAKLAPETNDIGIAVTSYLQDEGYPNLYYYQKVLKKRGKRRPEVEKVPGWLTLAGNRSLIIEDLEKDVRESNVIVKDPFFCQEAYTFIYDGMGKPIAMGKHKRASSVDIDLEGETYSDDSILGKAITNHIRKTSIKTVTTSPK
jgi:hypothetical protein